MKVGEFLRKSGILRAGATAATYTSAKDRPYELMDDGVFDAKKDMTTPEDVKKAAAAVGTAATEKNKPSTGRKVFFWLALIVAVLFMISYLGSGVVRISIAGIVFGAFFFALYRFAFRGYYAWWLAIVAFVIFFVIALVLVPSSGNKSGGSATGGSTAMTLSELQKYDKKIVTITSADSKLVGTAGFTLKNDTEGKPYLDTAYNMTITDALAKNGPMQNGAPQYGYGYDYVNDLVEPKHNAGEGMLSAIHCNKEHKPSNPYVMASTEYSCPSTTDTRLLTTETFLASFTVWYRNYNDFLARTQFDLYDAGSFWEAEKTEGNTTTHTIDDDKVVEQGTKTRSFVLKFSE